MPLTLSSALALCACLERSYNVCRCSSRLVTVGKIYLPKVAEMDEKKKPHPLMESLCHSISTERLPPYFLFVSKNNHFS